MVAALRLAAAEWRLVPVSEAASVLLVVLAVASSPRSGGTPGTALLSAAGLALAALGAAGTALVEVTAVVLAGVGMVVGAVAAVPVALGTGMALAAVAADIVGVCMVPAAVGYSKKLATASTPGLSGSGVVCRMEGS